jgi:hypothetical protein
MMLAHFWPFGLFEGHLVYFMGIWDMLWLFGIHRYSPPPILVRCAYKEKSGNPGMYTYTKRTHFGFDFEFKNSTSKTLINYGLICIT